ncbi:MAG: IS21 family transposase [Clostridiaceae bacterium]|jgi:DNA-binding transcriptional regulator YhcF (GntR family)|nr:IS21 family transposase [Clostridiaceae bacterium]
MDKYTIIKLKQKGKSNRTIAKELGINRKTVSKYWNQYLEETNKLTNANYDVKEVQETIVSAPSYDTSNRKYRKYTKEMDDALNNILENEAQKARLLGINKQQLSNAQIHHILTEMGFKIGITTITNQIRLKRNRQKECFVKQQYDYGDRLEYDFGEVKLIINGKPMTLHMSVLSSPASNFRWAYLYKNQKKEVFLDSHVRFFEMLGGSYKEVVYDNMKNVVTRFVGRAKKELNEDLIKMAMYYGFEINTTNCYKGNEKGHVEGSVKIIRKKAFALKYKFSSYEEACTYLEHILVKLNESSAIEKEKLALLPYKPPLDLA